MSGERVGFAAYCRAFEVMGHGENGWGGTSSWSSRICNGLDPAEEVYSVTYLERGSAGDGVVKVPEYRVEGGQTRIIGHRLFTQDGNIIRQADSKVETIDEGINSEVAKYFIAGAFGLGEVDEGASLDGGVVDGLKKLYQACLEDHKTCPSSKAAKDMKARLAAIADERKSFKQAKERAAELQGEYDALAEEIGRRSDLLVKVANLDDRMPKSPATRADYEAQVAILDKKLALAKAMLAEEEVAANAERERREAEEERRRGQDNQKMIPVLERRVAELRKKINSKEGWFYHRFTNAFDAAMDCMPRPSTPEENYRVTANKVNMGQYLLRRVENFPRHATECLRSHIGHTKEESCHSHPDGDEHCSNKSVETTVCDEWKYEGEDYTEDELVKGAKEYCSTAAVYEGWNYGGGYMPPPGEL